MEKGTSDQEIIWQYGKGKSFKVHLMRCTLEGMKRTLCAWGPSGKEQWPHKRLTQSCPWVSRSLRQRCGSAVAGRRVGDTEYTSASMRPFEGGRHYPQAIIVNKRVWNATLGCNLKNNRKISVRFQGKPFNITVIQVNTLTSNAEEPEVELFYEDLQDLLELTPQKDVLFMIGDWNAKVGNQEIPGVTGKFGLGVHKEAGQSLIEFCQENTLVIANTFFQQHKRRLYTWTSPDGQYWNQIDYILCKQWWRCSIRSAKTRPGADYDTDHKLLIAKFRLKESRGNP